jgi:plasmid stability protein
MPNFTVAIPDELLARAKIHAATHGTSVNELIRVLLAGHLARAECALPGNYEILLKVALGQLSVDSAARQLHLDCEDDLFVMLTYCGLPRPRVSEGEEAQMRDRLTVLFDKMAPKERA